MKTFYGLLPMAKLGRPLMDVKDTGKVGNQKMAKSRIVLLVLVLLLILVLVLDKSFALI